MSYLSFIDFYKNEVKLSFEDHPFSKTPKHVWVICRFRNQWLLTEHPRRGIEFPGGKVEKGETADEAAVREVHEETGAHVKHLSYIGQYKVEGKGGTIIKNIYYAEIKEIIPRESYFETKGPVLMDDLPANLKDNNRYSFMMKDNVLRESIRKIKQTNLF
ncbi:RNA deprotection pyrophosphohydrolase [Pseudalkalibacillus caeni]|uniref:Nucleoside triphosphatase YtkD n=1 Tax=Exobacillus caeni TaxID=2574798 RepID=A0A5R9F9V1_9BACL|nr:nucleoside triphosphatase YtkD [Pseudalkalibacillus caeni]TLS39020.1 nucleoside triphosphatase YtkD [Pseudalkalibacillus caeni]